MTDLAKLTWPEVQRFFDADGVVALVPIGATEPHGPHLPLDTDVTIALAQARRAAERLAERGVKALVLPPVNYGLTRYTDGFAGWITLRPGTLWALLEDLVESLEDQGVRRIVFCNAHLEPEHVQILRGVAGDRAAPAAHQARVVFCDNTRRRWAETLGAEFQSGECHAGRYESSIVMAADPDGVRDAARVALPEKTIGLMAKMQAGVRTFREAGAELGYCGDPAAASADEGRELVERLAAMVVTMVAETWPELFA